MIRHHLEQLQEKKQTTFKADQKKLVKAYLYQQDESWIQNFSGFLFMEPDHQDNIQIKIRFLKHPDTQQIKNGMRCPLPVHVDEEGVYTIISHQMIKTVEKPQQNILYLKIGLEEKIIALSFSNRMYCRRLLQHIMLTLQNNQKEDRLWTMDNFSFLCDQIKQTPMYIDGYLGTKERIQQFCALFQQQENKKPQGYNLHQDPLQLKEFYEVVRGIFTRADEGIFDIIIRHQNIFEGILKCLSYNTFGGRTFDCLEQYHQATKVHNSLKLENPQIINSCEIIARIKFLRDVAACTFLEIPAEAIFNHIINRCNLTILQQMTENEHIFEYLQKLAHSDQYTFLCTFSQLWELFKSVLEDFQSQPIKRMFYVLWNAYHLTQQTLSAMGRLVKVRQIPDIHARFWQKWMEAMNPLLSYRWHESQEKVMNHYSKNKQNSQTSDLMGSLILILAQSDSNTKILVLDFVRTMIQPSQNRKIISCRYLTYMYRQFVREAFQYCNNKNDICSYLEFLQKIYVAEPVRTRQMIVEIQLFSELKSYLSDKFAFIMLIKLLKTFIEVEDTNTFVILSLGDLYDGIRERYLQKKRSTNIINSLFLGLFKSVENVKSNQVKSYLYRIFFNSSLEEQVQLEKSNNQKLMSNTHQINNIRPEPTLGFQKMQFQSVS